MCDCDNNDLWVESLRKQAEFEKNARKGIFPEGYDVKKLFDVFSKELGN